MKKYQSIMDFNPLDWPGETIKGESKTVPGEALTPKELLQNYVKGGRIPPGRQEIYENPDSFDDYDETRSPDFDLADFTEQQRRLEEEINARKEAAKAKKLAKEETEGNRTTAKGPTVDPTAQRGSEAEEQKGGDTKGPKAVESVSAGPSRPRE